MTRTIRLEDASKSSDDQHTLSRRESVMNSTTEFLKMCSTVLKGKKASLCEWEVVSILLMDHTGGYGAECESVIENFLCWDHP